MYTFIFGPFGFLSSLAQFMSIHFSSSSFFPFNIHYTSSKNHPEKMAKLKFLFLMPIGIIAKCAVRTMKRGTKRYL
jgi:hypothetical protein